MFSISGLLPTFTNNLTRPTFKKLKRGVCSRYKKKIVPAPKLSICIGKALTFGQRYSHDPHPLPNPYGYSCSLRCRHPIHTKDRRSGSRGKSDDFISEHIYKKYTETDSRPLSPDLTRRSVSVPRGKSIGKERRRCVTPEPETRQCQFHNRRILILDLRRVKSVDAIVRQDSRTPATSIDSTYGDDDGDYRSSSANQDSSSLLFQYSPRQLSLSRSITPKTSTKKGKKPIKDKPTFTVPLERPSSPKILEGVTLPPLHSSVLALLGQRTTTVKSSPRQTQDALPTAGAQRQKKLRRHGRNKNKKRLDDDTSIDGQRAGSEEVKKADEPHETQMSAIENGTLDADGLISGEFGPEDNGLNLQQNLSDFRQIRHALHTVLDDFLVGKPWSPLELASLDDEIEEMEHNFQKLQSKFQTESIKMKTSTWLGFPRTWSRNSATFRAPSDSKTLQTITPLKYLETFVAISEPRRHLYTLVFQRYRTMENPAGKTITLKTVQPAISEILGRNFLSTEMEQLCDDYLHLNDMDMPIVEETFLGISAFCERIYVNHSLEDCDECFECSRNPFTNKKRCHKEQKDLLEQTDFGYLFAKVRNNEINNDLSNMITSLCNRN